MTSLVSNFIINPVLRQARRFSSGFATEDPPLTPDLLQYQRTTSTDTTSRRMSITTLSPLVQVPATPRTDATTPRQAPAQARAQDTTTPSPRTTTPRVNGSTLPEDDGMGSLRRRIKAVQSMDVSQDLKAQLMHQLLIEGYTKSQLHGDLTATLKPGSPSSSHSAASTIPSSSSSLSSSSSSAEPPLGALHSLKFWQQQPPTDSSGATGPLHNLRLTAADLQPTYVPKKSTSEDDADDNDDEMLERLGGMRILVKEDDGGDATTGRLGCEHYRRNVKMQCATCERWYTCRFCHDAAEDHALPRKETKNMLCMLCGCAQRASDCCVGCGESAACYYCGVCKLWNDDPNKAIYHCGDCGLCRVGQGLGKDFFHCKKCMACISMTGGHKCIERSIDCDCPICGEYMFSSPRPVVFMQCGHSIHRTCFNAHMQTSYKCPLCNKSCVNMEYQFRNYDMAILTQPMPAEYRDARAVISCNDCSAKCQTAYHWLGLKCTVCNSYNTVQLQLL
ncbi:zinc-ribbon-domain-containing protein, partial [Bombardia bombarda]